jgi:hypothetical protein
MDIALLLFDVTNSQLRKGQLKTIMTTPWNWMVLKQTKNNISKLDCNFDPDILVSTFPHTAKNELEVASVIDACQMLNVTSNSLAEYQVLTLPGSGKIKWQHIQQLHKIQMADGLNLGNKLTKAHIESATQKMKV